MKKKEALLQVFVDEDMKRELKVCADYEGENVSYIVRKLLREYIEKTKFEMKVKYGE